MCVQVRSGLPLVELMCCLTRRWYLGGLIFLALAIGAGDNTQAGWLPGPLVVTEWLARNLSENVVNLKYGIMG